MICDHPAPIPHAVCYALGTPEARTYAVALHVFCPACQQKFRFVGHMPQQPDDVQAAILEGRGAWVDESATELAVVVAPDVIVAEADITHLVPMGNA